MALKIVWTSHTLVELESTINYLEKNWTENEIRIFAKKLDHTIELISKSPKIFPISNEKSGIRRAFILKYNNLYYRINHNSIEIISLFSNRQSPKKIKI